MKKVYQLLLPALLPLLMQFFSCTSGKEGTTRPAERFLLVGCYTGSGENKQVTDSGIYLYKMDEGTGALRFVAAGPASENPSFLAVHPGKKMVYAVNENLTGEISCYSLDTIHAMLKLVKRVSSGGSFPCHISVSANGLTLFAANYGSGTLSSYKLDGEGIPGNPVSVIQQTGSGPNKQRQEGPHTHMALPGPEPESLWSTNLGNDHIYLYKVDQEEGSLNLVSAFPCVPGAGPRHMAFHPTGSPLYVLNELNGTIAVLALTGNPDSLELIQTISTLTAGDSSFAGSADIHLTPDGHYLYASNRAEINNLAIYRVDSTFGTLSPIGHQSTAGKSPRNFAIAPKGNFLLVANQNSNNIVVYRINKGTGLLEETGLATAIPSPVCLLFLN